MGYLAPEFYLENTLQLMHISGACPGIGRGGIGVLRGGQGGLAPPPPKIG